MVISKFCIISIFCIIADAQSAMEIEECNASYGDNQGLGHDDDDDDFGENQYMPSSPLSRSQDNVNVIIIIEFLSAEWFFLWAHETNPALL